MSPKPKNEAERLKQLAAIELSENAQSSTFDRICSLAQAFFGSNLAMVSIVGSDRQWFASRLGTTITGSSRQAAFCAHTILQDEIFVVRDARADKRFAGSPLVAGEPHIRFYAGVPIMLTPGVGLGAVCVADQTPKSVGAGGRDVLRNLAALAANEIRLLMAARAYYRRGFSCGHKNPCRDEAMEAMTA